jgi:hypothetical protein
MNRFSESPEWGRVEAAASRVCADVAATGLSALSLEEQVLFLVWIGDGEVGNGGMHAVCYNSAGAYLNRLPGAFRAIGAPRKAELVESLSRAFGPGGPSLDDEIRGRQHESLSRTAVEEIDRLDDLYFSSGEDVGDLLVAWTKHSIPQGPDGLRLADVAPSHRAGRLAKPSVVHALPSRT